MIVTSVLGVLWWLALSAPAAMADPSGAAPVEYFLDRDLKHPRTFFTRPDGNHFSDTPACRKGDCRAIAVFEKSRTSPPLKLKIGPGGRNPAAVYCEAIGGSARTFYLRSLDEVAVCVFPVDGSSVDSWDLYRAHFKR